MTNHQPFNKDSVYGYTAVLSAYVMWGILPIYWNLLKEIPPLVVLVHRVVWSFILIGAVLIVRGELGIAVRGICVRETRRYLLCSAVFLVINWLTYIWAMGQGRFIEASIGYFLCPLFTIFLGAVMFGERLTRGQLFAVICLVIGIALPIIIYAAVPWVAIALAASWAGYACVRKLASIRSLHGVFVETGLLSIPVTGIAAYFHGVSAPVETLSSTGGLVMMICAGLVTALPQIALLEGLKRISLIFAGVTQYTAPTLTLLLSVVYFGQTLRNDQVLSLVCIWTGIFMFFSADWLMLRSHALVRKSVQLTQALFLKPAFRRHIRGHFPKQRET